MLVVKVELWPAGSAALARALGTLHIGNESQLADVSDYQVIAMELANNLTGQPAGIAEFRVLAHARRQRVWALLQRACEEAMKADWVDLPDGRRPGPPH
ncbi:hypothetical protein ABIF65_007778 [Bradyrhizobium japonicum]|uniref:hypothetical protein n=1 Tax=Bradyrhizobium TaxID=374 RepID=UPI00041E1644|nr:MULTISPECIES: hypothetical protein [Bradyrhizobium]MBR0884646.1 hypothetical protein [Bradyrhizobium liaoningense]MBR1000532.1 hypothetical protein [Bradyrhizobium liaoningense]MCP1863722.1 hypothetical protein [Bradyrhizobium japonicum]MCW2327693.1 hypothetical protein [Bradyrhizobium japonicum]WLB98549.1 hypothetical protein QIH92_03290 [Bradyrhizobium japonicum USDA 123]